MLIDTIVHHLHASGVPFRLASYPSEEAEPMAGHRIAPNAVLVDTRIIRVNGMPVLVCCAAGDAIDADAVGRALGGSASPAPAEDLPEDLRAAEPSPPPLGQLLGMPVIVDERIAAAAVLVFRVTPGSDYVELPFADFARAEQPRVAAIAQNITRPGQRITRAVYDVFPIGGGWMIRLAGDSQSELAVSRSAAVARACELGARHREWRVRVFSGDGQLEREISPALATRPS